MAKTNVKTRTGNRVEVSFDGKRVGLLQNLRMSDDYGLEPASGVGDIHAVENVPSMARHSLSASAMVLKQDSLREIGIAIENGDGALQGLVFDIAVVSKDDQSVLRKYTGCSFASGDVEVSKHSIIVTNCQFMALDVTGTGL